MIVKILERPYSAIHNTFEYNEKKKSEEEKYGELLSTNLFGDTAEERYREFKNYIDKDLKNPMYHIFLRLPKGEHLNNEQFDEMGQKYMDRIGLGEEKYPYQIVRHFDVEDGEHIHIIVSKTTFEGERFDDSKYKIKSNRIRKELEEEYGLSHIKENAKKIDKSLNEINMFAFNGKISSKQILINSLEEVMKGVNEKDKLGIDDFVDSLKEKNIYPIFNLQNGGEKVSGISFYVETPYGSHTFKGSQVKCAWNDLKDKIDVIPEDKIYLNTVNSISIGKSTNSTVESEKDDKELKAKLEKLLIREGVEKGKVDSIKAIKLDPKLSKSISLFLKQSEKGTNPISQITFAEQLVDLKLSRQEYSLFVWEKNKGIKDARIHSQAYYFLKENEGAKESFSWVMRYPPAVANVGFKQYLSAYDFNQDRNNFSNRISEQQALKLMFCKTYGVEGNSQKRFLNTPLPRAEFEKLKNIMDKREEKGEALSFMHNNIEGYSTFLRVKIGEMCAHTGASPSTAKTIYSKFVFSLEKNDLDHKILGRMYGITKKHKPSEIALMDMSNIFTQKKDNSFDYSGGNNFFKDMFSFLSSLHQPSQEERDVSEKEKQRRRRRGLSR